MRPVEVKHLRRRDVDLVKKLLHVRRSKNESSHRVIPLNASALTAAARMFERADLLGHTDVDHYLWPSCQWGRYDATKPMLKWDTAWRALRDVFPLWVRCGGVEEPLAVLAGERPPDWMLTLGQVADVVCK